MCKKSIFFFFSGLSATLIWYTPFAIWGKPYTFRCRITDAAELFDQMCFHREKDSWCFHQKYAECVVPVSDAFVLGCDNGTHTKASPTKVYSLQIKSASPADGKKWWCELRKNSVLSKVFKLGVRSKTSSFFCHCRLYLFLCFSYTLKVQEHCPGHTTLSCVSKMVS